MFKVKAKFIGKNSLGFINGRVYDLNLNSPAILVNMAYIGRSTIQISTNNKPRLRCEYNSWELFISNWHILSYENMTGETQTEGVKKVNMGLKQAVRDNKINSILK